MAVQFMLREYY